MPAKTMESGLRQASRRYEKARQRKAGGQEQTTSDRGAGPPPPENKSKTEPVGTESVNVQTGATEPEKPKENAPKTNAEYIQQVMWANMPKEYLLTPSEASMLGDLSPETRDIPLPMLKFLLRPADETPAQLEHDYRLYKQWTEKNLAVMADFERNYRIMAQGGNNVQKTLDEPVPDMGSTETIPVDGRVTIPDNEVSLLYFFNSECHFCGEMTPVVRSFLARHQGIKAYGFVMDEPREKGEAYLTKNNIPIPAISPTPDVVSRFEITPGYPRTVLVDLKTGTYMKIRGYPRTNPKASLDIALAEMARKRASR